MRYTYEGDAEVQHIKVIGGNHTWYLNENQYDISYFNEIHNFFTKGNGGNVGLAEPESTSLRLWPNPTNGYCTLEVEKDSTIEIIDLQGRVMTTCQVKKGVNQIDLSNFSEGMYLIKTAEGSIVRVIVSK